MREPYLAFSEALLRRLVAAGYDDLRPAHLVVFQHIDPAGSRVTDLAAKAQMTKPSMGYLVEQLEDRGYVRRVPDPGDGRARLVQLTERGRAEIDDALTIIGEMEDELGVAIGPTNLERLRRLLVAVDVHERRWLAQADPGVPPTT